MDIDELERCLEYSVCVKEVPIDAEYLGNIDTSICSISIYRVYPVGYVRIVKRI